MQCTLRPSRESHGFETFLIIIPVTAVIYYPPIITPFSRLKLYIVPLVARYRDSTYIPCQSLPVLVTPPYIPSQSSPVRVTSSTYPGNHPPFSRLRQHTLPIIPRAHAPPTYPVNHPPVLMLHLHTLPITPVLMLHLHTLSITPRAHAPPTYPVNHPPCSCSTYIPCQSPPPRAHAPIKCPVNHPPCSCSTHIPCKSPPVFMLHLHTLSITTRFHD